MSSSYEQFLRNSVNSNGASASPFDDVVSSYLNDPTVVARPQSEDTLTKKMGEVSEASARIKQKLSGRSPETVSPYQTAAVARTGTGLSTLQDPTQRDQATLSGWEMLRNYGPLAGSLLEEQAAGSNAFEADRQAQGTRSFSWDRAKDVSLGVGQGFANSLLGIGALGLGGFDAVAGTEAGTWASRKIGDLNESIDDNKSDSWEQQRRLYGTLSELSQADNREQYENEKARDGEFVAGLRRIGRDAIDTVDLISENPDMLRDTVSQGTGSLLAGGPISKVIKGVGRATIGRAVASNAAARYGAASAMPIAIGAMEAGGAYQQTVQESLELLKDRTDLTQAEKSRIANMAGLEAAAIQGPIGAATGVLTSKFEANPFLAAKGVRSAASNIAKEGVEEFAQSASGQAVSNLAIRDNVDPNRSLAEGVGEQAALGLVGGIGAAGIVQAPSASLGSAVDAAGFVVRKTREGVDAAVRGLESRNQRVLDQVQSESPVSQEKMDAAINAAKVAAPEISQNIINAVNAGADPTLTDDDRRSVVEHFDKVLRFDPVEEAGRVPSSIRNEVEASTDRFDVVRNVAEIAKDENQPPERRLSAGLYLMGVMRQNDLMLDSVPEEALAKLPQDDPAVLQVEQYQTVLESLARHPLVRDAIAGAMQLTSQITPEKASSNPEMAKDAARLASLAPEKTDPEVNRQVLLHAVDRNLGLTQEEQGYLKAANAVHEATERHAQKSKELGLTTSEIISREIQTDKSDPSTLHKSAIAHMDGIIGAIDAGNTPLAQRRMRHFMGFAQSMQNKVSALNENLLSENGDEKNRTAYEAYNPRTGQFFTSKPGAYLIGSSRGSVAQAQQTAVDADAVAYIANELVKSFPELGIEPIEVVPLNAAVSQTNAREAARDYKVAKNEGKLAEYLGLSEATSPNKRIEEVLASTQSDQSQNIPNTGSSRSEPDVDQDQSNSSEDDRPTQEQPQQRSLVRSDDSEIAPPQQQSDSETSSASEILSETVASSVEPQSSDQPVVESVLEVVESSQVAPENQTESTASQDSPEEIRLIDASYPDLLGSNQGDDNTQKNLFKASFDLPQEDPISRLVGQEDPVSMVRSALKSNSGFRRVLGDASGTNADRVTPKLAKAYDRLLSKISNIRSEMDKRLGNEFARRNQKGKKVDLGFEELRAMNIARQDGTYDPELRDNAVLAGLQWLLTDDQRRRPLDAEDVGKILNIPVTDVTDEQVSEFNQGSYLAVSVSDLGNTITRFWGVTPESSAPIGMVRGIPEGVAKEVLRGMEEAGLVRINEIKDGVKTYYQVESLLPDVLGEENYSEILAWPSAIETVSIVEPEEISFIGSPPKVVSKTQLRNPLVRLTPQQREMMENEQATPHRLNLSMTEMLSDLGEDLSIALFGHGDLPADEFNVNHRKSLESVNLTIRSAHRAVMTKLREAQSWASANGVEDVSQVPIHYRYEFTSVNRLQMIGAHNPQANKLTREAILPTWSTLDLTDKTQRDRFMLGVAQAWGVKVHKKTRGESIKEVIQMAEGRLAPAIEMLSGRRPGQRFREEDVAVLRETLGNGGPVPAVALHAAMEYSKFVSASLEDKQKFTTGLYVEADGITDGPINAMVHSARGAFTRNWIEVVRKGGLFLGQPGMTANASSDKIDLYQHTTNFLRDNMARMRNELASDSENNNVVQQMDVLHRVMARLLPDVSINDDGQLVIERGLVKNPLTVTIYGAGAGGIAAKITEALTKAVYERESQKLSLFKTNPKPSRQQIAEHLFGLESSSPEEAARKYDEYNRDMGLLLNRRVEREQEGLYLVDESDEMSENTSMRGGPEGFTMLPRQIENLRKNVLRLLVGPMRESIQAAIGETSQGVDTLRRATQVQSIYLEHAFRKAVQQKIDAKKKADPSFRKSDFLDAKEMREIYEGLSHLAPYIRTDGQNLLVSGSEKAPIGEGDRGVSFSRDLTGKLSTPASVFGPADSGVSGIPYVVIGTGDGLMMQIASTMPGAPENTLKIFDGMNMPLDRIEEQSRSINEAVYRGWLQNPLDAVAKSYSEFVRDGQIEEMSEEQRSALSEALLGRGQKGATKAQILEMVRGLEREMSSIAVENQARKNVLSRVQMTVDHMASAEASYEAEGDLESLEGMSDEQIVFRLNELYSEELTKLVEGENTRIKREKSQRKFGEFENIPAEDLPRFVARLGGSKDERDLLVDAARALKNTDWSVSSLGSPQVINGVEAEGYTDFGARKIVIGNGSTETLLHEMIHASTLDKVVAYYEQDGSLSKDQSEAVARIELLMDEWLENVPADLPNLNEQNRRAMLNAQASVMGHLGDSRNGEVARRANALNEFMAWVLSNQELARAAGRRQVKNPLARIVGEVLDYLKKLFSLTKPGQDIYSNLKFNTQVLMRSERSVASSIADTVLFQTIGFGTDDRLTRLRESFFDKVARHAIRQVDPARRLDAEYKAFVAKVQADEVFDAFDAHGYPMDAQQASTFQMMVSALATEIQLDPNVLQRVEEIYRHVIQSLTGNTHLLVGKTVDDVLTPSEEFQAQERFNVLTGAFGSETDEQGRSTLLPAFLALAAVHDDFRNTLSKLDLPKTERLPNDSLDNRLTNIASEMIDRLGVAMGGESSIFGKKASSVRVAVDALTDRLSEIDADQRGRIEQYVSPANDAINKANSYIVSQMQNLSRKTSDRLENVKKSTNKPWVKTLAAGGQLLAGVVDEEVARDQARSIMSLANKRLSSKTAHEFLNELVGRTTTNAPVYDMIKAVRSSVQQVRQQFREHLPELLAKRFDREVTDQEWSSMFYGMARTDLAALRSGYSVTQILEFLGDPSKVSQETSAIESKIRSNVNGGILIQKAQELADFMITQKASSDLLRNANAIERLLGQGLKMSPEVDTALVSDIDHLVSLYALERISDANKEALSSLVQDQKNGVSFVLSYLEGQRRDELSKVSGNAVAEFNHFKGYVPSIQEGKAQGRTLVVLDDQDYLKSRRLGLVRVADYEGVSADNRKAKMGYYFSTLRGSSVYNQGVLQTARHTASGVDPVTGYSTSVATAGRITDPDAVERIRKRLSRSTRGNEQLMPVFAPDGSVVAYERSLDPIQQERLGKSTNLADMIGVWRGRQVEELLGQKFNEVLVERLHDIWDKEEVTNRDEYVNLLDSKEQKHDPVLKDAVSLIPRETRETITSLFGEDQFWVRRDMINDAVGYRKASVGDQWTGTTRFSEQTQKTVTDLATAIFGIDAYKKFVQAETLAQNFVTDARVLIVVKSMVVPFSNLVANIYQLSTRGVPLTSTVRGMPKKLAEVNGYVRDRLRVMEVDAELRAAEGANDLVRIRKLEAEKRSIEDGWKRLSIWPLVEAGELTSVSDVGIGKEEIDLTAGKLNQYVEGLVDRLPQSVRTAGRYFVIGRDTALFKGLQKSVEYGDFLAKAILYEDLVKRQGKTKEQALAAVTEEFVNYDRLSGRSRDYLENMGLMWFWNFKIRSVKIALSMIRNNPLHALLTTLAPAPPVIGSVGSPMTDNLLSVGLDNRLEYSIGPGQGLRAHQLLPWVQLID